MAAFCTAAQLLRAYDQNRIADYVTTDPDLPVDPASLTTDPIVADLLEDGADMIRSAARNGGRYTDADLLVTGSTTEYKRLAVRLNADLTYGLIVARKGYTGEELDLLAPRYGEALKQLELLERGDRIFDVLAAVDAGTAKTQKYTGTRYLSNIACRLFGVATYNAQQSNNNGCCSPGPGY